MENKPKFIESFGITTKLFTFDMDVIELSTPENGSPITSNKKESEDSL